MKRTRSDTTPPDPLPQGYVEKADGTIAPTDRIWNPDQEAFEEADEAVVGTPVAEAAAVATPAYWVTYDGTTGIVWGVGTSPEESIQAAKFEAYGEDGHGAVGYEFACWCEELSTTVCSETLYSQAQDGERLSLSDENLRTHVLSA
jgi:hypothetical protein